MILIKRSQRQQLFHIGLFVLFVGIFLIIFALVNNFNIIVGIIFMVIGGCLITLPIIVALLTPIEELQKEKEETDHEYD